MKGNDHGKGRIYALPWKFFCRARSRYLLLLFLPLFAFRAQSQGISLTVKEASLESVLKQIQSQSPYQFIYTHETLASAKPVTLNVNNASIPKTLTLLFEGQPLSFQIEGHYIMVKSQGNLVGRPTLQEVTGMVLGEKNEPIPGATVRIKGTTQATSTDNQGAFTLKGVESQASLLFTSVGYQALLLPLNGRSHIEVHLSISVSSLDQTLVIAYGTTTKRMGTGNVSKVTAEEISRQPVSNPLAALHGKVPGMIVTQSSGLPGASVSIQIRGRTALDQGLTDDQPLFIIDGVPFAPNNGYLNVLRSALGLPDNSYGTVSPGGLSPFSSLNPSDIESIEVLKDADATAIYGSRGANGVVLITTKKGKGGKTEFTFDVQQGWSQVAQKLHMLNTRQYLDMRHEAFQNDVVTPTSTNAYDLFSWDTTRYTDFIKLLTGGTAHTTQVQGSVSGGSELTRFTLSSSYLEGTSVFPYEKKNQRETVHFSLHHTSPDKKFSTQLSGSYASDQNQLPITDLTSSINLPPNFRIYDSLGGLAWNEGGLVTSYSNPLAALNQSYNAATDNLVANLQLGYRLVDDLNLRVNTGFNTVLLEEVQAYPLSSQNPLSSPVRSATFATNRFKSWIVEPQAEYNRRIGPGKLQVLVGSTWQNQDNDVSTLSASGYVSDALLNSVSGASSVSGSRRSFQYRYGALFSRIGYNLSSKYILNLSVRRDGSSKFGPGKQFANFGSVGAAWIFSSEPWMKKQLGFISFGKLRGSYGLTGNDKIIAYQYLDTWEPTFNPYQGSTGLTPTKLFNPDYHWEKTTKLEGALDLGFFKDRLLLSLAWYRNQSSNQLVQYKLPGTTGFSSVIRNLPAVVQNTGLELMLSGTLMRTGDFNWNMAANLTFPKTRLASFPGLSLSSYATRYVVGEPLNVIYRYRYTGVDPNTGLYTVEDTNKDNVPDTRDYQVLGSLDPLYYGGLQNIFAFKGFALDIFFHFVKQTGENYLGNSGFAPGSIHNMPLEVLERWQKPGDVSPLQRFTQLTSASQPAYNAFNGLFQRSDGIYSDASFIRLKNLSLSYNLEGRWLKMTGLKRLRLYVNGQNLLTFTPYKGGDPETQNYLRLPPLRTMAGGIQLSF
jgi:TonB-linked SusC/RagA family outer membrane protein